MQKQVTRGGNRTRAYKNGQFLAFLRKNSYLENDAAKKSSFGGIRK